MRIFDARGKDYYDGVMYSTFHGDEETLFIREEKEVKTKTSNGWDWRGWSWGDSFTDYWPFGNGLSIGSYWRNNSDLKRDRDEVSEYLYYIGFCGMVYPVIKRVTHKEKFHPRSAMSDAYVEDLSTTEYLYEPLESHSQRTKDLFEGYKNPPQIYLDKWAEMMKENRSPIFIANYEQGTITWNPHLEEYDFPKVVNAWDAGKAVYQFLSNLGRIELEIPEEDDIQKAERHGFDKKTSFRKEPQK